MCNSSNFIYYENFIKFRWSEKRERNLNIFDFDIQNFDPLREKCRKNEENLHKNYLLLNIVSLGLKSNILFRAHSNASDFYEFQPLNLVIQTETRCQTVSYVKMLWIEVLKIGQAFYANRMKSKNIWANFRIRQYFEQHKEICKC